MANTTSVSSVFKKGANTPVFEKLILNTVAGDQIDIFAQLLSLVIYEDIFSPVITGTLTLSDNINLFYKLPICGQEQVTVRFYSWNYDPTANLKVNYFHRTFDVLKVSDIMQTNDYTTQYTLHLASPELKKNETIRVSKAYAQTTMSKVVATLMTEDYTIGGENNEALGLGFPTATLDQPITRSPFFTADDTEVNYQKVDDQDSVELFVEKTKFIEPWVTVPYMKPFDIINWLASRSLRNCTGRNQTQSQNESSNFVFFENKRGFQFTSIDTLLENKQTVNTRFSMGNAAQNQNSNSQRFVYTDTIEKLQILDCYDQLANIRSGLYASTLYGYDINTGEITEKTYDYLQNFKTTENTESGGSKMYPFIEMASDGTNDITQRALSKRILLPFDPTRGINNITSESTQRDNNTRTNIGPEAYVQMRSSQLAKWTNFRIVMEVAGSSVHTVGNTTYVDLQDVSFPDNNYGNIKNIPSKYYSGYYLMTSIRHSLTKFTYNMSIECAKDSYKALIGNP